jgi:hypothetical protein
MQRFGLLMVVLVLAACGSDALIDETFTVERDIPQTLQIDGLIAGIADQEDVLRVIVEDSVIGAAGTITVNTAETLADYSISARVYITQGEAQLWARTDEAGCAGYILSVDPTNGRYRLSLVDENCDVQTLDSETPIEVLFNQWYNMRLSVQGTTIRGFIDNVEFFNVDDERYAQGLARVRLVSRSVRAGQIDIENITIR